MRGLDVLDVLADGPLPLAELSSRLGLSRSTTHRLAGALVGRRMLNLRAGEGYSLGPKLLALGYAAGREIRLARVSRPHIVELSQRTGDTVHVGVLENGELLYLDKVPGTRRVSIVSRVGERQPIASTGLGKALILDMSEAQWLDFYAQCPRRDVGSSAAIWLERMRAYARGGYAFDLEENEDQIRCVAGPIRAVNGDIVGAVSLSSAAQYMDDARMQELIPIVLKTCETISRELGWS